MSFNEINQIYEVCSSLGLRMTNYMFAYFRQLHLISLLRQTNVEAEDSVRFRLYFSTTGFGN